MFRGSTEELHKHTKQGRNRELGQDKEQSMAKGKHPGMGDLPDIHGDTGEGIAAYAPPSCEENYFGWPCSSSGSCAARTWVASNGRRRARVPRWLAEVGSRSTSDVRPVMKEVK